MFTRASHPYTVALHRSLPRIDERQDRLTTIEGQPPDLSKRILGCPFAPRCPRKIGRCESDDPPLMRVETARKAAPQAWTRDRIRQEDGDLIPGPASPSPDCLLEPTPSPRGEAGGVAREWYSMSAVADSNSRAGEALLTLEDLRVWFPAQKGVFGRGKGVIKAVDGVSLEVLRGETLGLVGESGCGKTTTAHAILQLLKLTEGRISFEGVDLSTLGRKELRLLRRRMQPIFQDPFASLNPKRTVARIVAEPLVVHRQGSAGERRARVQQLLETVGLPPDAAARYPHTFSGGQRQRISIARAMALRPDLIIADEPVSSLDVSIRAQILNLLADLQDEFFLTYVVIAHDLALVRQVTDRVAVMYLGSHRRAQTDRGPLQTPVPSVYRRSPLVGADP